MLEHTVFVQNSTAGSRKETAVLLVGTAQEFGIDQRSIRSTHSGFFITEELADLVYDDSKAEPEAEPEPEVIPEVKPEPKSKVNEIEDTTPDKAKPKSTKKTSGNRAAKNKPTEKE